MAIKTFKRYECKYSLNSYQASKLISMAKNYMDPDEYCIGGKKYTIYNIYFDDDQSSVIRHSLSKPYYKEKLRLRCYTSFDNPDQKVYFELKKKIGSVVSKRRAVMTLREASNFFINGKLPFAKTFEDKQVIDEIAFYLKKNKVKPKVYISYERQAFFGKDDRDFRLTIDNNILSRRTNLFNICSDDNISLLSDDQFLMEIKVIKSIPLWLSHEMSELGIHRVSFSKYGAEYKTTLKKLPINIIYSEMDLSVAHDIIYSKCAY